MIVEKLEVGQDYIDECGITRRVLCVGDKQVFYTNMQDKDEYTSTIALFKKDHSPIPKPKEKGCLYFSDITGGVKAFSENATKGATVYNSGTTKWTRIPSTEFEVENAE